MKDTIEFDVIDERGPQTFVRVLEISAAEIDRDEIQGIGPVSMKGKATAGELDGEYETDGRLDFTADFLCVRCLEPYPFANSSPFHVRFRPRPEAAGEADEEIEISEDELDVTFYSQRSLNLKDLAIEQIQLAIPMKPLCDDRCPGLCATCGAVRAAEACACQPAGDVRWDALKGIREELEKKKES